MEIYNSEQEQVDALKAWWDKNGRTALTALALFLLSVLGWQGWNDHRQQQAEAASSNYQQMVELMGRDASQAKEAGRALIGSYPNTLYAAMASLALAKLAVAEEDLEGATAHLRSAMTQSDQPELAGLARLRLARVELAQGKAEAALQTLNGGKGGAASDELRGDLLLTQGKPDEARAAYRSALDGYGNVADKRELVQMKLDDLAVAAMESGAE
ncbi:MAG: tetratricopeptide repeat protein [Gammaproteobacteria bacterium]|nr:tetratricopeptide repeat protein [Gammaproteobacteria bacterium]